MKLEYKILWLDDKIQDFIDDEVIEEIEEHLKIQNFIPYITTVKNSKDFFGKLNDSYDLILTDYHMNDINGDMVIKELRGEKYSVMTEVLFYTAKADLKDIQKISRISFLETNSMSGSHIENVIERTIKLIDLTIKKFQHIVAMRGMIMHETSSLDVQMLDIIKNTIKNAKIDFSGLSAQIYDELLSLFSKKTVFVNACKEKDKFNQLTKDTFVYSSKFKIDTLSKIIRELKLDDFSKEYQDEIITIRNKFAHAVLEKDEAGREFFKYKDEGITFDEEYCKKIRKDIIKHSANLDELQAKLTE